MVSAEGKNCEICHSRLPENVFASTRIAKNVPWKFFNNEKHFWYISWCGAKIAQKSKTHLVPVVFSSTSPAYTSWLTRPHSQGFFSLDTKIRFKIQFYSFDGSNYLTHLTAFLKLLCWLKSFFLGLEYFSKILTRRVNCSRKYFFHCDNKLRTIIYTMSIHS